MYSILLHRKAHSFYRRQDAKTKARLDEAFSVLRINPFHGPRIKQLTGELSHLYRYRVGELRILYEIHEDLRVVRVKAIGSRGDIYR
jgi:mRNA interferase RelE/StbE